MVIQDSREPAAPCSYDTHTLFCIFNLYKTSVFPRLIGKWRSKLSTSGKEPTLTPSSSLLHWREPRKLPPGKWWYKAACALQGSGGVVVALVWTGMSSTGPCVVDLARSWVLCWEVLEISVGEGCWEEESRDVCPGKRGFIFRPFFKVLGLPWGEQPLPDQLYLSWQFMTGSTNYLLRTLAHNFH